MRSLLSGKYVRDLTEDDLLSIITPHLPQADGVIVPSGDDSAVIPASDGRYTVSTDMLVEGHHFRRDWSSGADVGWRAATQNLADAVAMGAAPRSIVVSMGLPGDLPASWVESFAIGIAEACGHVGCGVDGGDLVGSELLTISVTVMGDLQRREPRLRSAAHPGQALIHCGELGRGYAGLELLTRGYTRELGVIPPTQTGLIDDFLRPKPPLVQALDACRENRIGAMMDVSDGLIRDARRMAKASNVWIDIESNYLAQHIEDLIPVARRLGLSDPWEWAMKAVLTGGEDHGFLATLDRPAERAWGPHTLALPEGFSRIGQTREAHTGGFVTVDGKPVDYAGGWDHFGE
ncbi:MAG: thiamine-phosphate kinase [Ancrocorticia sp.]|uniref:thiamine-phosphate kinase n=1 Tax=Ancrocorticia sp. TaxID=2593684 RepID=UPI003F8EB818